MGKAGRAIKAISWILRKPVLLNRVLEDEWSWQQYVEKNHRSQGLPVVTMEQLVKKETISLEPLTFLDGGSLPTDLMLLAGLAEEIGDCNYFEIGTWRGESVSVVASRARQCHTLCLTDEEMRARGMHERAIRTHRIFSEKLKNVTQHRGDSRNFDFRSLDMKFDLVYIDGDHHYESVLNDTKKVFANLTHEGTTVVWHDYGFHPDRVRFEVMAAILDGAGPEKGARIYHVAHTKCAVYTGREMDAGQPLFPSIPADYYAVELTRKKI